MSDTRYLLIHLFTFYLFHTTLVMNPLCLLHNHIFTGCVMLIIFTKTISHPFLTFHFYSPIILFNFVLNHCLYQPFKDSLYVTVVRAEDLPSKEKGELCNPYVKLCLLPRHRY